LVTKNKGDWTYGKIVVRAKMPSGRGTWPAIWMLPTNNFYGGWPYSGEIDIMEAVGYDHGVIHGTAHCEEYNWFNGQPPPGGQITFNDFDTEFHNYIIEWDENSIKWFVDDIQYHVYSNTNQGSSTWPFDQDFHLILNIAIGKPFQNKGHGFKMVYNYLKSLPRKRIVLLEVKKNNYKALKIYYKLNFQKLNTRKAYYNDGTDAVNMILVK